MGNCLARAELENVILCKSSLDAPRSAREKQYTGTAEFQPPRCPLMHFEYEIYPAERIIVTRYTGKFTLADLTTMSRRLWSDARYSRAYDGIVDLTDSSLGVARADLQAIIEFVRGSSEASEGRWAAIANSPFATACGMIYQRGLVGKHSFEVFSTLEAAGWFLGVDFGASPVLATATKPRRI